MGGQNCWTEACYSAEFMRQVTCWSNCCFGGFVGVPSMKTEKNVSCLVGAVWITSLL